LINMSDEQHQTWLNKNVSLYRRMSKDLRADLLRMIPEFIGKVKWVGHEDFHITEEIKVCIAAEACVPILRLKGGMEIYRRMESVEVYPKDLASLGKPGAAGDANGRRVRLGWHWAQVGMEDGHDGYNLVIHEFAHIIDFASSDGKADGVPRFNSYSETRDWEKFVSQNYEDFQRELGKDNESFSDYGSSNEAEFFACATESFFERGEQFKREWPEIYDRLKDFYGMDPLLWTDDKRPVDVSADLETQANPEPETKELPEPAAEEELKVKVDPAKESDLLEVKVNDRGSGSITEYHANGKRAGRWELRDNDYDGPWRRWNNKGELIEQGWYRKGVREGKYQLNHSNGKNRLEGVYRNDLRDGLWRLSHDNGKLKQENHYQEGDLIRWEVWQTVDKSAKFGLWE